MIYKIELQIEVAIPNDIIASAEITLGTVIDVGARGIGVVERVENITVIKPDEMGRYE